MRSAYQVLGIPANADAAEVQVAFDRARLFYTPERLATVEGAVDRFNEVQTAYAILRDPASRAAHDRKLTAPRAMAAPVRHVQVEDEEPAYRRYFMIGLAIVGVLFAAGFYLSYRNAEARKEQAAMELAARQAAEREEEARRAAAEQLAQERERARIKSESDERRLVSESRAAAARAAYDNYRQEALAQQSQRMAAAEAQRKEALAASEQRRAEYEAQRRIAADRQRIRELCMLNYRRPDC